MNLVQMYQYFISSLQRSRNKRPWSMRYWMQLKTFLPKNTMVDPCLTFTHVAEHPVAKHSYFIGQFAHNAVEQTPLNSGHPRYNGQFWKSRLSFHWLQYLSNPWIADTPLLRITDSFRGPNCTQAILNDPDLVDTRRPFQQDCLPSLL